MKNPCPSIKRYIIVACLGSVFAFVPAVWSAGLPGEPLVTQRWRELSSTYAPLLNPAFMTEENYTTLRGAFTVTMQGAFRLWEVGAVIPLGLYQSIGVTWLGDDGGQVEQKPYSSMGQLLSDAQGVITSNTSSHLVASYALNIWRRLSVGGNLIFVYQSDFGSPVMGVGLDLGASYRLLQHAQFGNHIVGLFLQDLLAPSMGSSPVPQFGNAGEYARDLKLSWYSTYFDRQLENDIDFDIKDFLASAEEFKDPNSGTFDPKKVEWGISHRIGIWMFRFLNCYAQFGWNQRILDYWGIAAGVKVPAIKQGRDIAVLYQFNQLTQGDAANTHTWYIRTTLGHHRNELYASDFLEASPNDLYNKALHLYYQGKYWDAFFVFGRILSQYPTFFKNDWVNYYMSSCQEMMDMRNPAVVNYQDVIVRYPKSDAIPYADLGMMRVFYREGQNDKVTEQFGKLNNIAVKDSIRYHANYLMGETAMRTGSYPMAIQCFSVIPETNGDYLYAQHSMAVAYILRNEPDLAIKIVEKMVDRDPKNKEEEEIINRSLMVIGYLFYEQRQSAKAVVALRKIPAGSYYHEDALLGLGWTAAQNKQWGDLLTSGQQLQTVSQKVPLQCEGALLEGYAQINQKNYVAAAAALQSALDKLGKYEAPSDDSLEVSTRLHRNDRYRYDELAKTALDLSSVKDITQNVRTLDSLHGEQKTAAKKLSDYLVYADEFNRLKLFSRNVKDIKSDLEYAVATAEKNVKMLKGEDQLQEELQKRKQIDDELQKAREEMKKLEDKKKIKNPDVN